VRAEHDENFVRKDFLPSEMVAIARALRPSETEAARQRLREAGRNGGKGSGKFPEASAGRVRDKVAAYVGISGRTLVMAEAVVTAAEVDPEKYGHFVEQMDGSGRIYGVFRNLLIAKKSEEIRAEPPALPNGPFRVIVIDPPWPFEKRNGD